MHVRMQRSERREEVLFRHSGQLALGEGIRVEGTGQMSCAVTQSPSFLIPHLSSPFSPQCRAVAGSSVATGWTQWTAAQTFWDTRAASSRSEQTSPPSAWIRPWVISWPTARVLWSICLTLCLPLKSPFSAPGSWLKGVMHTACLACPPVAITSYCSVGKSHCPHTCGDGKNVPSAVISMSSFCQPMPTTHDSAVTSWEHLALLPPAVPCWFISALPQTVRNSLHHVLGAII